jgi:predicted ATPase/class 3 adenylate cyclase
LRLDVAKPESYNIGQISDWLKSADLAQLIAAMPLLGGAVTLMFTDIVESTRVKAAVGDEPYFAALEAHKRLIREAIAKHRGQEIQRIGDAFLVGFGRAGDGVACAVEIQTRLECAPIEVGGEALRVRIGLHTGSPILYRDPASARPDLSGTDVDKAARVEGLANGGQVLISEETRTLARPQSVHDWGLWFLKGLGPNRVFEVLRAGKTPQRPSGRSVLQPVRFMTAFVGREAEISAVMRAVGQSRLVTLRGIGGIGKTRLAEEVMHRVSDNFPDGVFWTELAQAQNSEAAVIAELVSQAKVDVAGFADERSALLATLENHRALLVLNNFEGVMAAAPLASDLLRQCSGVHCLVTSQRLLELDGEQEIEVLPMLVPAGSDSIEPLQKLDSFQLFRERARLKKPAWDVTPENAGLVAEILELTDGIPLRIELAAARVEAGPLQALRDGLASKKRSEYLARKPATAVEKRHASMRACLHWSFSLLSPEAQALLPMLSVFKGGFFAGDVAAVCRINGSCRGVGGLARAADSDAAAAGAVLEELRRLSLLTWTESLGETRYQMLPVVQDYAAGRLSDPVGDLRQRHSAHFLTVLDCADDQICGKEQMAGLARISADLENIRLGMESANEANNHRAIVRYAHAFGTYLRVSGRLAEGLARDEQGLRAAQALGDAELIAGCQNNLGIAYRNVPTGDRAANLRKAIQCYEAALRVYTERDFPLDWAMTQNNLGNAYEDLPSGDRAANLRKAIECFEAALRVRTERDLPVQWAMTQNNLGNAYSELPGGDRAANVRKAIECYEAALRVRTERDSPLDWAMTQNNRGTAYSELPGGDRAANLRKAIDCYEAALRVRTERDSPLDWAMTQNNLGGAYSELPSGDRAANSRKAIECCEAALRVRTERDFPMDWAMTQNNLGIAYQNLPSGDRAANSRKAIECCEAALRVRTERDFPMDWAMTQYNLGIAYRNLPSGDRAANLRKAIECYEAAARGYAAVGDTAEVQRIEALIQSLRESHAGGVAGQ